MKLLKDNIGAVCLLTAIAAYGLLASVISGCANSSIAPTGGPKDTIAPVLIRMNPPQRTKEFKGKELIFTFNEYVQLKDQSKNFVISPPLPSKKPILKIKGKSVVVSFPSLADSVTYYIDFGASVVDVNENNPANYLNFIFSTGDVLDTMIYAGHVVDAFTLDPVSAAHVFLYEDDTDSIVFKQNPSALSITNKEGVFIVKGLKNRKYKLTAVTDKNSNMRYDAGIEQIAFPDSLIQPDSFSENDSISFYSLPIFNLFTENVKRQALMDNKRPEERLISLRFNEINPVIKSFRLDDIPASRIIEEASTQGDSINFWITSREVKDTITGELIYLRTDTLNNLSPDTVKIKLPYAKPKPKRKNKDDDDEEEEEIIPIKPDIRAVATSIAEHDITFVFKTPLLRVDTSKMQLLKLGTGKEKEKVPVTIASFIQDSIRLTNYKLSTKWEVASKYEIVILPEAFVDIYSITNDTVTKTFDTADPEKFGKLIIEIINSDKQYILQLMKDKDKKVQQEKIADGNGETVFQYLNAGNYRIRLIEDINRNGKWDTGSYLGKKQAERVVFLVFSTGETFLEIKTNREDEQTIDASVLFDKSINPPSSGF
ncbi:MAG: Ig-like domain-containing protein [Prevotellaceae bacterium]|nr:Ig-like domain-containing protein [Prevotellaceae bacterium]